MASRASFPQSLAAAEEQRKLVEREQGKDTLEYATALKAEADALGQLGRNTEALDRFLEVLAIREAKLGPTHGALADVLTNLAIVEYYLGRPEDTGKYARRALSITEVVYGKDSPENSVALTMIGTAQIAQRDYAGALATFQRSVQAVERSVGKDDVSLADPLANIGSMLVELKRPAEAVDYVERAVAIATTKLGPENPDTAQLLVSRCDVLRAAGQLDEAIASGRKALAIQEKAYGPNSSRLFDALAALGRALLDAKQPKEASQLLDRALAAPGGDPTRCRRSSTRQREPRGVHPRRTTVHSRSAARHATTSTSSARVGFQSEPRPTRGCRARRVAARSSCRAVWPASALAVGACATHDGRMGVFRRAKAIATVATIAIGGCVTESEPDSPAVRACGQSSVAIAGPITSLSVAPTSIGAVAAWVGPNGAMTARFAPDRTMTQAPQLAWPGTYDSVTVAAVDDYVILGAVTDNVTSVVSAPFGVLPFRELGILGGITGALPAVIAGGSPVAASVSWGGLLVNGFDDDWNVVTSHISVLTPSSTQVAMTANTVEAMVTWSTDDACYFERVFDTTSGAGWSDPTACTAPRLASTATNTTLAYERAGGIYLANAAPAQLHASDAARFATGSSPRIITIGTTPWLAYLDTGGAIIAGPLDDSGAGMSTPLGSADAFELTALEGRATIFAASGDALEITTLCAD